jgi:hypothetical protein
MKKRTSRRKIAKRNISKQRPAIISRSSLLQPKRQRITRIPIIWIDANIWIDTEIWRDFEIMV